LGGVGLVARKRDCLTMYMGDPHKVAAITPSWRNLANPKSAANQNGNECLKLMATGE